MRSRAAAMLLLALCVACSADSPWSIHWTEQARRDWVAACAGVGAADIHVEESRDRIAYTYLAYKDLDADRVECDLVWDRNNHHVWISLSVESRAPIPAAATQRMMALAQLVISDRAGAALARLSPGDSSSMDVAGLSIYAGYSLNRRIWDILLYDK